MADRVVKWSQAGPGSLIDRNRNDNKLRIRKTKNIPVVCHCAGFFLCSQMRTNKEA